MQARLAVFTLRKLLDQWVDMQLAPVEVWLDEIQQDLVEAEVALLLVSVP